MGMTRDEVSLIYDQGREAVIDFVMQLANRVSALEAQLAKNSHNSNKPPSSDGLQAKPHPKSLRGSSGKRPGGQPGHPGSTLRKAEKVDEFVDHCPSHCAQCGQSLEQGQSIIHEQRQVHDLPPIRLVVTEHTAHAKTCPACGHTTTAHFPPDIDAPVQYGPRIKALGIYLTSYQLLPLDRCHQMLNDLTGASFGEATLNSNQEVCSQRLVAIEAQIKTAIIEAPQAHFDETGIRVNGRLDWLHVASNDNLTYFAVHEKRGKIATESMGILPQFHGTAIHDDLATYLNYKNCSHALCNAHHLRELTFIAEEEGYIWAQRLKEHLLEGKKQAEHAKKEGRTSLPEQYLSQFTRQYDEIVERGLTAHPLLSPERKRGRPRKASSPPVIPRKRGRPRKHPLAPAPAQTGPIKQSQGRQLAERLQKYSKETLRYMHDLTIPFDNNLAERDLRMMKVKQKISGCFRTFKGAQNFCRIRGYVSTMSKQGRNALDVLAALVRNQAIEPAFQT